jgi:hypothetical protein
VTRTTTPTTLTTPMSYMTSFVADPFASSIGRHVFVFGRWLLWPGLDHVVVRPDMD